MNSYQNYKTPAAEKAELIVGIASVFAPLIGPLFMLPMIWVYEPHGWAPWLASLGLGLIAALLLTGALVVAMRKGLLGPMQVVFAGLFLGFGVMTATSGVSLLANGLFDRAPATSYEATVEKRWKKSSTMTNRYSNTRTKNHRAWVNLTLKDGPYDLLNKVAIDPRSPFPEEGQRVRVEVHSGALGWPFDVQLEAPTPDDGGQSASN